MRRTRSKSGIGCNAWSAAWPLVVAGPNARLLQLGKYTTTGRCEASVLVVHTSDGAPPGNERIHCGNERVRLLDEVHCDSWREMASIALSPST